MQIIVDFWRVFTSKKDGKIYTLFQCSSPGATGENFCGREHLPDFIIPGEVRKYEPGELVEVKTKIFNVSGQLVTRIVGFID